MNEWISVSERLPELGKEVLIYIPDGNTIEVDAMRQMGKSDGNRLDWFRYYPHNISHWMPLPATPDTTSEDKENQRMKR